MRTVNARKSVVGTARALAASVMLLGFATGASAQQVAVAQSDYTAGYVVLPKVVVHTTGSPTDPVLPGEQAFDTLVQMTNTNQAESITVDCWWINANGHCGSPTGPICTTNADCTAAGLPGVQCVQGWGATDFQVILSPGQPIGFTASSGLGPLPCDPLFPGPGCRGEAGGEVNFVPEDPFRGELKCVQVDENDIPVVENDLKIEATIVSTTVGGGGSTTAAAYNGVGFRAQDAGSEEVGDPLCLGSLPPGTPPGVECAATYAPCPGVLHMQHFFENANTELGSFVTTDLTLVPCSEDIGEPADQANLVVTAQILVYNEFEQRFSTSTRVSCYQATRLSDIDTQPGPAGDQFSIFNVGVQGTITGQSRIRGVRGPDGELGYGLLGVGCEMHAAVPGGPALATTAFNLNHVGFRAEGDAVYISTFPDTPPPPP